MQLLLQVGHSKFPKSRGITRLGCKELDAVHPWELWPRPPALLPCASLGYPSGAARALLLPGETLLSRTPLTKPHGQGKLPTAVPVWERVSDKPGSSQVMLCANNSEAPSRIWFCWLCFFPPDPGTAALLPSGLLQERLLTWLV